MSEGPKQTRGKRRPSLSDALEAAMKAGLKVRSAVQEADKVVLVFGDNGEVSGGSETDWGEGIKKGKELKSGKCKTLESEGRRRSARQHPILLSAARVAARNWNQAHAAARLAVQHGVHGRAGCGQSYPHITNQDRAGCEPGAARHGQCAHCPIQSERRIPQESTEFANPESADAGQA